MADRKTTAGVDEPTPIPGALRAALPTEEEVRRHVGSWVTGAKPGAHRCRIVVDYPDGERDVTAVPLRVSDDLESQAIEALGKLKPGEWMKGRTLAAELGIDDPNSGHFRRAMAKLTGDEKVESGRAGYRLK